MHIPYRLLTVLVAVVFAAFALGACGDDDDQGAATQGGNTQAGEQASVEGKSVVLLTVTETCEYCALHLRAFRETAEAAGLDLDVVTTDFDAAEQAQQVNQAIAQRPDLIVYWPADATAAVPSIRRISEADIPLVVSNSKPLDEEARELWTTFTGPDDLENGRQAARAMIQGLEEAGEELSGDLGVVIGVPGTPPAIQRLEGFEEVLQEEAPDLRVAASEPGNWDQTEATRATGGLLTQAGGNLKGLYAQADNMLAGSIVAARRQGVADDLVMVGSNCSVEGVRNIEAGRQYATVLQSPIDDGKFAAEAAIAILRGEEVEKERFLPNPIITEDNVEECFAAIGRDTAEEGVNEQGDR